MKKFKVRYVRSVEQIYEVEVLANDEYEADDIVSKDKYGDGIEGEVLIESNTDCLEVIDVEEVEED